MGGVVLLNDAPLPYENKKIKVNGNVNVGYDTNARGFSDQVLLRLVTSSLVCAYTECTLKEATIIQPTTY